MIDWVPTSSVVLQVFDRIHETVVTGRRMIPRSASDKEYFAQDWFRDRLVELGLSWVASGRNQYPDYWVTDGEIREGYEIKSLSVSATGRPARKDFDTNSTIPSGLRDGSQVFIAFFLYTGAGDAPRSVHSIILLHGDLVNDDRTIVHENHPIPSFGSYGDGFIRDRKMYRFNTPFTIDPTCLGRVRLIVPTEWGLDDRRLVKVSSIDRSIARDQLEAYQVNVHARTLLPIRRANPRFGQTRRFEVFEHA